MVIRHGKGPIPHWRVALGLARVSLIVGGKLVTQNDGSERAEHLAGLIMALARREAMKAGDHLIEQMLADGSLTRRSDDVRATQAIAMT